MSGLPFSSAAERNRQPILDQLMCLLPATGCLLEIGSGTGQHAVFFSPYFPSLGWQPSEKREHMPGLEARVRREGGDNVLAPLPLDVILDPWPRREFAAAFSANTAHFMPWNAVVAMFRGLSACLLPGAVFCLYGPFNVNHAFTSDSNQAFDAWLRAGDAQRGIRDLGAVERLANHGNLVLQQRIAMPANNFLLVFEKHD